MGTYDRSRNNSKPVFVLTFLMALIASAGVVEAASLLNSCTTYCHGMPPRDAARKGNLHFGSQSSAFVGNHKNHLAAAPSSSDCSICHAPVGATNFGHQNNIIEMAVKLKGYSSASGRAKYDKGVFLNQTSLPIMTNATCSNASCHFEKKTPVWGSTAFNPATDCNACHGVPPSGAATGTAGSHARHEVYFPGTANCQKCHPGYATFTHATSAGRALRVQGYLRDPLNALEATGTYSGSGANYLPSQAGSQVFGSCNNIYCHSSAQGLAGTGTITYRAVTWGSGSLNCGSCHLDMFTSPSATGSHVQHAQTAAIGCAVCHGASYAATSVPTGSVTTHVDKNINLGFSGAASGTTYSKSGTFSPGSAYGTCTNVYCHGASMPGGDTSGTNRTPTWNVPFLSATLTAASCGACHGFPPSAVSGHPVVTIPAGFPTTATIGTTCSCHANINPDGNSYANIFVDKSLHINGTVDVAAGGACDSCHGYPPVSVGFVGTQNNWSSAKAENYPGAGGAHSIQNHVSKTAKPGEGFANCTKCHNASDHAMSPIAFNPSQNIKISVNPRYRLEAGKQFKYSSNRKDASLHVTGTCSNTSCHFGATPKWDPAH